MFKTGFHYGQFLFSQLLLNKSTVKYVKTELLETRQIFCFRQVSVSADRFVRHSFRQDYKKNLLYPGSVSIGFTILSSTWCRLTNTIEFVHHQKSGILHIEQVLGLLKIRTSCLHWNAW